MKDLRDRLAASPLGSGGRRCRRTPSWRVRRPSCSPTSPRPGPSTPSPSGVRRPGSSYAPTTRTATASACSPSWASSSGRRSPATRPGSVARPRRSTVRTLLSRLGEMVLRPPAPVAGHPGDEAGDVLAVAELPGVVRTSRLAHAAVAAVSEWNARGGGARRPGGAGAGRLHGGRDLARGGRASGFLRLTHAQRPLRDDLRRAIAEAPLQVGGSARDAAVRRSARLIRWASTRFAGRLGSTVLVSHLGAVSGPGITGLAFYPLSGTGSGLSVGAVTCAGRTTLTLRARGSSSRPERPGAAARARRRTTGLSHVSSDPGCHSVRTRRSTPPS